MTCAASEKRESNVLLRKFACVQRQPPELGGDGLTACFGQVSQNETRLRGKYDAFLFGLGLDDAQGLAQQLVHRATVYPRTLRSFEDVTSFS